MQYPKHIRIGSRSSPLALRQSEEVKARLQAAYPALAESMIEIVPFVTTGDKRLEVSLYDIGGKGLFTKELEEALLAGTIDMAVHSLKDVTAALPAGLIIGAMVEREDPRDGLVCLPNDPEQQKCGSLWKLADGTRMGTASPRRGAQVLMVKPDAKIVHLRGNVATRLEKLKNGAVDATLLAMAGLKRLGLAHHAVPLSEEQMLPAIAQGTIGIECREKDEAIRMLLADIAHEQTQVTVQCERVLLAELEGSCHTPLAGHVTLENGMLTLNGLIATPDGSRFLRVNRKALVKDGLPMAKDAAHYLLTDGKDILCHA